MNGSEKLMPLMPSLRRVLRRLGLARQVELGLQRRRAAQPRLHAFHREIDDRGGIEREQLAQQQSADDGDPEQRGRDRAVDEGRRDAHGLATGGGPALGLRFAFSPARSPPRVPRVPSGRGRATGAVTCPASSALDTVTGVPSVRRAKPVVTTRSPACKPVATAACTSFCCVSVTRRTVTVSPSLSTYTNAPLGPRWMAAVGTTTTWRRVSMSTRTLTNWPGQS